jgi:hypothetical protein
LKNLEIPVIRKAEKEDQNPINRKFGNNQNETNRQMIFILDSDRINNIQKILLKKMKDKIQLGLSAFNQ